MQCSFCGKFRAEDDLWPVKDNERLEICGDCIEDRTGEHPRSVTTPLPHESRIP